jgi:hypothetical protein
VSIKRSRGESRRRRAIFVIKSAPDTSSFHFLTSVRPPLELPHQTIERMGDCGLEAPVSARMSLARDNPTLGSLRRAVLSEIEAILNASRLRQVKRVKVVFHCICSGMHRRIPGTKHFGVASHGNDMQAQSNALRRYEPPMVVGRTFEEVASTQRSSRNSWRLARPRISSCFRAMAQHFYESFRIGNFPATASAGSRPLDPRCRTGQVVASGHEDPSPR